MHRHTARCTNHGVDANTIWPPRATLATLVLQLPRTNFIYGHYAHDERMQLAQVLTLRSLSDDVQSSASPETPGSPSVPW